MHTVYVDVTTEPASHGSPQTRRLGRGTNSRAVEPHTVASRDPISTDRHQPPWRAAPLTTSHDHPQRRGHSVSRTCPAKGTAAHGQQPPRTLPPAASPPQTPSFQRRTCRYRTATPPTPTRRETERPPRRARRAGTQSCCPAGIRGAARHVSARERAHAPASELALPRHAQSGTAARCRRASPPLPQPPR